MSDHNFNTPPESGVPLPLFFFICATRGKPLVLQLEGPKMGVYFMSHSMECSSPMIRLITVNPRQLGVITGITEP